MKFSPTSLPGVWLLELEPRVDERGFFARTYCEREFAAHGLNTHWPQGNLTRTLHRGMIRGLHWQAEPKPEIKLVRCAVGAIWDVVVASYCQSSSIGLSGLEQWRLWLGLAQGLQKCRHKSRNQ